MRIIRNNGDCDRIEAMPTARPVLCLDAAREHLVRTCATPDGGRRHGVELEWHAVPVADPQGRPDPAVLARLAGRLDLPGGSRLTFEPGGQVELSSAPRDTLAETWAAVSADLAELEAALAEVGLRPEAGGLDPRPVRRVVDTPRYRAMEAYFDREGPYGRRMMCNTAAVQVNAGLGTAAEFPARCATAERLGPILAAAFAHSPGGGWRSARLATWAGIDPSRCAPVGFGADPGGAWADYALGARVMLVRIGDDCAPGSGQTFVEWIERGSELGWPSYDDLDYHLTTLFPPVRLRGWLELRTADMPPARWWPVPLAVAVAALDRLDCPDTGVSWAEAGRTGLADPLLREAAREVFEKAAGDLPPALADLVVEYAETRLERA
jgi:glutamate--cysteine ligase